MAPWLARAGHGPNAEVHHVGQYHAQTLVFHRSMVVLIAGGGARPPQAAAAAPPRGGRGGRRGGARRGERLPTPHRASGVMGGRGVHLRPRRAADPLESEQSQRLRLGAAANRAARSRQAGLPARPRRSAKGASARSPTPSSSRVAFGPDARFASEEGSIYENPKSLAYRMMVKLSDHVVYAAQRSRQSRRAAKGASRGEAGLDGRGSLHRGREQWMRWVYGRDGQPRYQTRAGTYTRPSRLRPARLLAWSRASSPGHPAGVSEPGLRAAPSCRHGLDAGVAAVEPSLWVRCARVYGRYAQLSVALYSLLGADRSG